MSWKDNSSWAGTLLASVGTSRIAMGALACGAAGQRMTVIDWNRNRGDKGNLHSRRSGVGAAAAPRVVAARTAAVNIRGCMVRIGWAM